MRDSYFTNYKKDISNIKLPERFTYPFYYTPHPLSAIAAEELQEHLLTQKEWVHDFGIDHYVEGTNIGKMFGVLVVRNKDGEIGYLSAFSGKLAGKNNFERFVPPIFDSLEKGGFYRKGEAEIVKINKAIVKIEHSEEYVRSKTLFEKESKNAEIKLTEARELMKKAKKDRDTKRAELKETLSELEFAELKEQLKNESLKIQYDFKNLNKSTKLYLEELEEHYRTFESKIKELKKLRKTKSAQLQQRLFDRFQFLNIAGEYKGVCEIFSKTTIGTPPSGAGDCAAPKLLQYAFLNNMTPIAMAEFWWGQSPNSEIRKHKQYYPACRGKCEPILGHMLKGMKVDKNPILSIPTKEKEIEEIYEDEHILIINKPAEFLSVPGKNTNDCVYHRIRKKFPDAESPLIVHRLDMSTSGIMIITKTKESHVHIQKQFLDKTVKKRYVALLNGNVDGENGTIDLPLRVDLNDRPRQLVCYDYGKRAVTHWKVIERNEGKTKVHFFPVTGRTHQLRVHSAHPDGLNIPIVGDDLYGTIADRLYLHAEHIEFIHPETLKKVRFAVKANF